LDITFKKHNNDPGWAQITIQGTELVLPGAESSGKIGREGEGCQWPVKIALP
jgi:hypothetical protein